MYNMKTWTWPRPLSARWCTLWKHGPDLARCPRDDVHYENNDLTSPVVREMMYTMKTTTWARTLSARWCSLWKQRLDLARCPRDDVHYENNDLTSPVVCEMMYTMKTTTWPRLLSARWCTLWKNDVTSPVVREYANCLHHILCFVLYFSHPFALHCLYMLIPLWF